MMPLAWPTSFPIATLTLGHQALTGLPEDDRLRLGVTADWENDRNLLTYRQNLVHLRPVAGALA